MKNWICENCEMAVDNNFEFCPKCGLHKDAFGGDDTEPSIKSNNKYSSEFESSAVIKPENEYNAIPEKENSIENLVRQMAKNISTIKSIMVFFTVLWGIGVVIAIVAIFNL